MSTIASVAGLRPSSRHQIICCESGNIGMSVVTSFRSRRADLIASLTIRTRDPGVGCRMEKATHVRACSRGWRRPSITCSHNRIEGALPIIIWGFPSSSSLIGSSTNRIIHILDLPPHGILVVTISEASRCKVFSYCGT